MNDDPEIDWRFLPLRSRVLVVVNIILFTVFIAIVLCGLPSHCAGPLCVARLWDFCCYLRACWVLVE